MSKHCVVEPKQFFQFSGTWELTLKCNLDCSYCGKENHNNKVPHPNFEECKETIDFLIEYINLYMENRPSEYRNASMDIFGGESLFHPDIVEILDYFNKKHEPYKDKWNLYLNTITNAVVKDKIWNKIVDKLSYWTISYHPEASDEQLELVRKNILDLKKRNKNFHVAILMHAKHWDKCIEAIEWCKLNEINVLPRQIDHAWHNIQFYYSLDQANWLRAFHKQDTEEVPKLSQKLKYSVIKLVNMNDEGRQCCGGKQLVVDENYNNTQTHVDNTFKGWQCSVNHFFIFVKQHTKEIFVNKDCMVNFEGEVGPIGNISNYKQLLEETKKNLNAKDFSLRCVKKRCLCGICTPKAETKEKFTDIFQKYTNA